MLCCRARTEERRRSEIVLLYYVTTKPVPVPVPRLLQKDDSFVLCEAKKCFVRGYGCLTIRCNNDVVGGWILTSILLFLDTAGEKV
jgi:hypothetical protein